ncbi:MAG: Asp-tRNA(Asn)/Glu-tRNA(Gln) amidotransferase subunit GatA [Candidatus Zixiibacteriota bacterium]
MSNADRHDSAIGRTKRALDAAATIGKRLNAVLSLCTERAFAAAEQIDKATGKDIATGILSGIPVLLKDNICLKDYPTTCASKMLERFIPPYNATIVDKLDAAGAIIIGKTNLDEFAMGSSNENSFFGPVLNPINEKVVPGGSSGGSAAVVAAGIVPIAYGSDTGGSVRQPASFCGVVGMKPTHGAVSRYGLTAFASSLDQIGPIAATVSDCARGLKAIIGHDVKDATSLVDCPVIDLDAVERTDRKYTVGVLADSDEIAVTPDVKRVILCTIDKMKQVGHSVEMIDFPLLKYAVACYYIIATAEASANLARYDSVRFGHRGTDDVSLDEFYSQNRTEGFGTEVKRRILLGTYVLSEGYYDAYYLKACKIRKLICSAFDELFSRFDIILTPTSPTPPFGLGERLDKPLDMYQSDIFTIPASLAGLPAISIPVGKTENGLPIGVQLIGPRMHDETVLQAARTIERLTKE